MERIRVLVVDDSVVARRVVTHALSQDQQVEVVGEASNGREALDCLPLLRPDVVILDVEMPELGGLQTLQAIRASYPALPVIMFSGLTERGATVTLDALALGATDYVTKPSDPSDPAATIAVSEQLAGKIRGLFAARLQGRSARMLAQHAARTEAPGRQGGERPIDVVAIAVSTGGPAALDVLLGGLAADFPLPILVVQHMPPLFTKSLAERLDARCQVRVREAAHGDPLQPATVALAPGDQHMEVTRIGSLLRIRLSQRPHENSCRPSADVLLRSVAELFRDRGLVVVMTGMGQDGLEGCRQVRLAHGQILVQDEASSVVWGMPGSVFRAGLAHAVVPLADLAAEISRRARVGRKR
jgi:two-component system chemotaxis response regulator CheB